jgi:hypothetical protein
MFQVLFPAYRGGNPDWIRLVILTLIGIHEEYVAVVRDFYTGIVKPMLDNIVLRSVPINTNGKDIIRGKDGL